MKKPDFVPSLRVQMDRHSFDSPTHIKQGEMREQDIQRNYKELTDKSGDTDGQVEHTNSVDGTNDVDEMPAIAIPGNAPKRNDIFNNMSF